MTVPEVTVVIATRDRWTELRRAALPAARSQEDVDLEIIVVDDGSTDGTRLGLDRVRDPRLRVLRIESSQGVAAARNRGIQAASAAWTAFLDDDDLWSPRKLRTQLDTALASGADFAWTAGVIVDEHGVPTRDDPAPDPPRMEEQLARRNIVGGPSAVLARTERLRALGGFDEAFSVLADWDLWIRLAQAGRGDTCAEPLVAYREHASNISGWDVDLVFGELDALVERHAVSVDVDEFARWVAAQQRRVGSRVSAARAYLRGARRARSGALLARAVAVPLGERVMRLPSRVRAAIGRPDQPPPRPQWLARYHARLAASSQDRDLSV